MINRTLAAMVAVVTVTAVAPALAQTKIDGVRYYDFTHQIPLFAPTAGDITKPDLAKPFKDSKAVASFGFQATRKVKDPFKTQKGFFQWGSMSFREYVEAGWKDADVYGDVALSLGWWMTHTHATLKRRRNHAYAVEGLIAGWQIANWRKDVPAQRDLLFALDRSLYKLTKWQIGGPLHAQNKWLVEQGTITDPMALGGVMNARKKSKFSVRKDVAHQLRIDVTQHQMHAVTLGLEDVYVDVAK